MSTSPFLFAVCQLDVEAALKQEVAARHPHLRAAFQRPGLVTWKTTGAPLSLDVGFDAILSRAFGLSFGRGPLPGPGAAHDAGDAAHDAHDAHAAHDAALAALAAQLDAIAPGEPAHLHVFPRDRVRPGEGDETARAPGLAEADALRDALAARMPRMIAPRAPAPGELVLDVVCAPGEPALVGAHRHHAGHSPRPGGRFDVVRPPDAPSRAYLKLLEGFDFAGLPLAAGLVAVEIGSAPGGAVWAMLERGLEVVAIDFAAMDPRLAARPGFRHLAKNADAVTAAELPPRVDYLLLDVNLAPRAAARLALRLAALRRDTLRGLVLTLKMNDWSYLANVDELAPQLRALGFPDVRARQLATNRREVCVVATRAATR